MDQTEYVEEVAERYREHWRIFKDGEVTGPLPLDAYEVALNPWIPPEDSVESMWFASFPYRQLVGALLWLMLNTRPDLAHAVTFCARWCQNPTYGACYVLCYLMTYVVSTKDRGLRFAKPGCLDLHAITDAALGADPIKRRSLGAWDIFGCGGPIAWGVKLMPEVCTSSMQGEYQTYYYAVTALVFIFNLMQEIGLQLTHRIPLFTDADAARAAALNPAHHQRTKHIELKYHFIRQFCDDDDDNDKAFISMERLPKEAMITDVQTKITPRNTFEPAARQLCGDGKLSSGDTKAIKTKHIEVKHFYVQSLQR
jgi:hypothetical protein